MYASDLRRAAREALRGRWGVAVGTTFVAGILGGLDQTVTFRLNVDEDAMRFFSIHSSELYRMFSTLIRLSLILAVVSLVIGGMISLGYCLFTLNLADRREARFSDIYSQTGRFFDGFCLRVLTTVFVTLWSLLFVIPGIIAAYSYAMAPYIMAEDPECTARQALSRSKEMMRGNKWRLFCLQISFIGWGILCGLTFGIGALWLNPYMAVTEASFYREVSGTGSREEGPQVRLEF